ncbi:MAG: hypothetical protein K8R48_00210 [Alphaproteobacteria bacterium]|nr:hypothetical protein [Alphaproteobacteria bacterium]
MTAALTLGAGSDSFTAADTAAGSGAGAAAAGQAAAMAKTALASKIRIQ